MYQNLSLFNVADAMARHAGASTAAISRNVANADTPGYRATATSPFADVYRDDTGPALRLTRRGHQPAQAMTSGLAPPSTAEPSPNGNDVSIEEQMLLAVEAQREHARAVAIYRHGLTVLRTVVAR